MKLIHPKDAIHKMWLYRILSAFYENSIIAKNLYFKGGTCAAMRGFLDRFSVDLDFDYVGDSKFLQKTGEEMEKIFTELDLELKDKSQKTLQYFLKYKSRPNERSSIKIDTTYPHPIHNKYEAVHFSDIDRVIYCQTIETNFANKLVALIERFEKTGNIAGRDIYDIHHFFSQGFSFDKEIILERRNINEITIFFHQIINFIEKEISQKIIDEDINMLLSYEKFRSCRRFLKREVLEFIRRYL